MSKNFDQRHLRIWPSLCTLTILLIIGLFLGCSSSKGPDYPQAPVILITIDTLRSDRLPVYGYEGLQAPFFVEFASQAITFDRAYAHSPITLPSHATIMTGLMPDQHGVRENIGFFLKDDAQTLAEVFQTAGYATGGFVSSMVLRPQTGIQQGFSTYEGPFQSQKQSHVRSFAQQSGKDTLAHAQKWVQAHKEKPFFLWVHLYEPHTPYDPPAPYNETYSHPYDGEIAYTDALLNEFFTSLKSEGLYDKSLVLLTSDHGESLGEHGEKEHGLFVYRPSIQVPFLLKLPFQHRGGTRENRAVGLVDVKPTLLALTGLTSEPKSGLPLLHSSKLNRRVIYSEAMTAALFFGWHAHRGAIEGEHHYIQGSSTEIFNLVKDPGETINLQNQKSIPGAIAKNLAEISAQNLSQTQISEADKAMLASLGYTGGFDMGGEILSLDKEAFLKLFNAFDDIIYHINQSQFAEAETNLVTMLQNYPTIVEARVLLGFVLRQQEKLDQAAHVYLEGIALHPEDVTLLKGLALTQLKQGDFQNAERVALKVTSLNPLEVAEDLIPSFFDHEQYPAVTRMIQKVLETDFSYAFGIFALGKIANTQKEYVQAADLLTKAVAAAQEQNNTDVYKRSLFWLGDTYARQGNFKAALNLFTQLLKENPNHAGARASLSMVYASQREPRKAIQVLDEWVAAFPTYENFKKAAETMTQIGLKDPAAFYQQSAEKLKSDDPALANSPSKN